MNTNAPETRGSAFAVYNLVDDLGKGLGPWVRFIFRHTASAAILISSCRNARTIRWNAAMTAARHASQVASLITGDRGRIFSFNVCVCFWLVNATCLISAPPVDPRHISHRGSLQ